MSVLRFWDGSKWVDLSTGTPYPVQALTAQPVLDVGMAGQIRAGRQLTAQDFTSMGLNAPRGLWNLSDLTDASGNGRTLNNKGAVPFAPGINGQAATAAQFAGSTGQALYIADSGAADPFRIGTGSWGCWFRTAKRGAGNQYLISKHNAAATILSWGTSVANSNVAVAFASVDGTTVAMAAGVTDVADDRWHFFVGTHDGTTLRLYVDGVLEATGAVSGPLFGSSGPLNIGAYGADGATAAGAPHYGRVDEAFVTADVLSEDQVRCLYCAKIPHTLGVAPKSVDLSVRRRRRGGALAVADFPTQPLRLHNFSGAFPASMNDEGSNGVALTAAGGGAMAVSGADGSGGGIGAFAYNGTGNLQATDAGLPSGLAARSYGCWFKSTGPAAGPYVIFGGWGNSNGQIGIYTSSGILYCVNGGDSIVGVYVNDGQWHFAAVVEDNAAGDGLRRKLYLDGRLIGSSTVLTAITLGGANRFRIGAWGDGTVPFIGQIDGVFVCGFAMTMEQVAALYAKGSQALPPSPKNAGDHVEALNAADLLATFDTLDSTAQIDLGVMA